MKQNLFNVLSVMPQSWRSASRRKELCKSFAVAPSTMSRWLRILVKAGWVRRVGRGKYILDSSLDWTPERTKTENDQTVQRLRRAAESVVPAQRPHLELDAEGSFDLLEDLARFELKQLMRKVQAALDRFEVFRGKCEGSK